MQIKNKHIHLNNEQLDPGSLKNDSDPTSNKKFPKTTLHQPDEKSNIYDICCIYRLLQLLQGEVMTFETGFSILGGKLRFSSHPAHHHQHHMLVERLSFLQPVCALVSLCIERFWSQENLHLSVNVCLMLFVTLDLSTCPQFK